MLRHHLRAIQVLQFSWEPKFLMIPKKLVRLNCCSSGVECMIFMSRLPCISEESRTIVSTVTSLKVYIP